MGVRVIEEFDRTPQARAAIKQGMQNAVAAIALSVEGQAKMRAPVDTGFLKNTIYTQTGAASDFAKAKAMADAAFLQGKTGHQLPDMLPDEGPTGSELIAAVCVGAEYGANLEYGTRKSAAQPFLTPAYDVVEGEAGDIAAAAINAELDKIR